MSDRDRVRDVGAGDPVGVDRRDFLGMLGVGSLVLATGGLAAAQECPKITCPTTAPKIPQSPTSPNLTGFPRLAFFVAALARTAADARTNRVTFNTCPNEFLQQLYGLSDQEVAAFLSFDPPVVLKAIGDRIPKPSTDPIWLEQYKLAQQTIEFWTKWTEIDPCYVDPLGPCPADEQQYAKPKVRIYDHAITDMGGGSYQLVLDGQGFVKPMSLRVVPKDAGDTVTVLYDKLNVDAQSTFRCGRMSPVVTPLKKAGTYSLELTVSNFVYTHPVAIVAP
jgi:hypothetical protein